MANDEHLALLRRGAAVWNDWRKRNPAVEPDLSEADLRGANVTAADLSGANLGWTNLSGANLSAADLGGANVSAADLSAADLRWTNLGGTNLSGANFSRAILLHTIFANIDVGKTNGLDNCSHMGPSVIDFQTLSLSGNLPLSFLRGCGLPDVFIDYLPSLRGAPI